MIKMINKNAIRARRHKSVRLKINGTTECPRLCVYRSTSNIYAQVIDDVKGVTLVSSSTLAKDMVKAVADMTKSEAAKAVGADIAKKALEAGITNVVFDRGGYVYTGRVKMLADGAREAGLNF